MSINRLTSEALKEDFRRTPAVDRAAATTAPLL